MNEQHLYHRKALNNGNYSEDDLVKSDNAQFVHASQFVDSKIASSRLLNNTLYLVGENISSQLEKKINF